MLEECNPNDRFKIDSIMVKGKVCQSSRTNTLAYTLCVRVRACTGYATVPRQRKLVSKNSFRALKPGCELLTLHSGVLHVL